MSRALALYSALKGFGSCLFDNLHQKVCSNVLALLNNSQCKYIRLNLKDYKKADLGIQL